MTDDDPGILIESTRGPDDEPVCLITWGPHQLYASVAAVRETAGDLMACAAYAEMMMVLVNRVKMPGNIASGLITDLLDGRAKRYLGSPDTVTMIPAGSTRTGTAHILLKRGSMRDELVPREAREMALQWLQVAEGTETDQLLAEALRATGLATVDGQARLFGYLRELRKRKDTSR